MSLRGARPDFATAASKMGVRLMGEQVELLAKFEQLLEGRGVDLGLVSRGDRDRIRDRHILDCLRAAAIVGPDDGEAYDLGSGAGLPGIVVGVARPDLRLTLLEARVRRVAFLEFVVSELGLSNVLVRHARVEDIDGQADLCFARAFAAIQGTWRAARGLLRPGGRLVYFAGQGWLAPEVLPEGASACSATRPVLESCGPLVIMTRQ